MSEEVAQEVFLEIWRLAPRYDTSKGSAKTWIAVIAHRRAVDRVRSEESRRRREDAGLGGEQEDIDFVLNEVDQNIEQQQISLALEQLPKLQRQAVTMAYFDGHTYREVARILETPEGTIKTRIRDGLLRLRVLMQVHS